MYQYNLTGDKYCLIIATLPTEKIILTPSPDKLLQNSDSAFTGALSIVRLSTVTSLMLNKCKCLKCPCLCKLFSVHHDMEMPAYLLQKVHGCLAGHTFAEQTKNLQTSRRIGTSFTSSITWRFTDCEERREDPNV